MAERARENMQPFLRSRSAADIEDKPCAQGSSSSSSSHAEGFHFPVSNLAQGLEATLVFPVLDHIT